MLRERQVTDARGEGRGAPGGRIYRDCTGGLAARQGGRSPKSLGGSLWRGSEVPSACRRSTFELTVPTLDRGSASTPGLRTFPKYSVALDNPSRWVQAECNADQGHHRLASGMDSRWVGNLPVPRVHPRRAVFAVPRLRLGAGSPFGAHGRVLRVRLRRCRRSSGTRGDAGHPYPGSRDRHRAVIGDDLPVQRIGRISIRPGTA